MSSTLSAFHWRDTPSAISKSYPKPSGTGAPAKNHPLRNGKAKPEANKIGSKSRAPTASINTERKA